MKLFRLFPCLFFLTQVHYAQDFQFSNPNQSLIHLNPSFAGSNGGLRNQSSFRKQWPGSSVDYMTILNSTDLYVKALRAGLAVSAWYDRAAGLLHTNGLSLSYAQYLNLGEGKWQIVPSAQVLYANKMLDTRYVNLGDLIDPRAGVSWVDPGWLPVSQVQYTELSAGFLTRYRENLYLGGYVYNMTRADVGLLGAQRSPSRIVLHAAYTSHISDRTYLQFFYKYQQQRNWNSNQVAVNLVFRKHLLTGVSLRYNDALLFNLGYRSEYFSFTVGYDAAISRLAGSAYGAWEAHLGFDLRKKEQRGKLRNLEN